MTLICEIKFQTHAYSVPEEAYSEVVSLESLNQWSWKGAFSNDSPKRIALLGRSFQNPNVTYDRVNPSGERFALTI